MIVTTVSGIAMGLIALCKAANKAMDHRLDHSKKELETIEKCDAFLLLTEREKRILNDKNMPLSVKGQVLAKSQARTEELIKKGEI
jgi:hypothetical protein